MDAIIAIDASSVDHASASSRAPLEALVTHRFALEQYADAIRTNVDRRGTQSVKTVFELPR